MNIIPIAFAFDSSWTDPACISLSSLMINAHKSTFYDIFIIHSKSEMLDKNKLDLIPQCFKNCNIKYIEIDNTFDNSFEIRGITTTTYYRLLIPTLIPEYDKIIYSDVDVIFREDLWDIYSTTDLSNNYIAGVNSLSYLIPDVKTYYENHLKLDSHNTIYAGNIILNSKALREDGIVDIFIKMAGEKYRFQDMDIINLVCSNKINYLSPTFCVTTYFSDLYVNRKEELLKVWNEQDLDRALKSGIIHYNGQKPWKGYCINFDIWWEYYRKSPFFNAKKYYDFFQRKLNDYDTLSLWKRIKILVRYFTYSPNESKNRLISGF